MANATSSFLQGANSANSASAAAAAPLDDSAVLAAISRPDVHDLASLASRLDTGQSKVQPAVDSLLEQGFIEHDGATLKLSEAGERALRYMAITRV